MPSDHFILSGRSTLLQSGGPGESRKEGAKKKIAILFRKISNGNGLVDWLSVSGTDSK